MNPGLFQKIPNSFSYLVLFFRLKVFKEAIVKIFLDKREGSLPLQEVLDFIKTLPEPFTQPEIDAGFEQLSEANQIMMADNTVFLI